MAGSSVISQATITNTFELLVCNSTKGYLKEETGDSAGAGGVMHLAVGRSQDWVGTPTANPNLYSERDLRTNLQSLKRVRETIEVVPRTNWSSGTVYTAWTDKLTTGDPTVNKFYVITEDNQVYVCLRQSINLSGIAQVSTVMPTGVSPVPFETSDGYVWKYLYSVGAAYANKFLSGAYMPVPYFVGLYDSVGASIEASPACWVTDGIGASFGAVPGQIVGLEILKGGQNYDSATTSITITGNGDSAQATAVISPSGVIVGAEMKDSVDVYHFGSGYDFATVTITDTGSGDSAEARAIIGPRDGLGYDARKDLLCNGVMFNVKPTGEEDSDWLVDNDFRQIALIKGIKDSAGVDFTSETGRCLRGVRFDLATTTGTPQVDDIVTNVGTNATAFIDTISGNVIYYHQNDSSVGRAEGAIFEPSASLSGPGWSASVISDPNTYHIKEEVDIYSGEIMYFNSRAAVMRDPDATEDMKIVVTF